MCSMPGPWNSHYSSNNSLGGAINWWQRSSGGGSNLHGRSVTKQKELMQSKRLDFPPFYHTTLLCSTTFFYLRKKCNVQIFWTCNFHAFHSFHHVPFLFLLSDMRWNTYQVHRHIKTAAVKDKLHLICGISFQCVKIELAIFFPKFLQVIIGNI